jgi:hypothetical protein
MGGGLFCNTQATMIVHGQVVVSSAIARFHDDPPGAAVVGSLALLQHSIL